MTEYRISEQRSFGPTLDFDGLPELRSTSGHAGRGKAWRRLIVALAGFWIVVGAAFAVWVA